MSMSNEENKQAVKALWKGLKEKNKAVYCLLISMIGSTLLFVGLDFTYVFHPLPEIPQTGSGIFRHADFNNPLAISGTETILYHLFAFLCLILLWNMFMQRHPFSKLTKFLFPMDYDKMNAIN